MWSEEIPLVQYNKNKKYQIQSAQREVTWAYLLFKCEKCKMALNNGLHYDLTDFKQADPFYHFCSGEGNIVPRVFLFSAAVLEWRRQFGDRVL